MTTLLFIDTNVFLDFYRVSGQQGGVTLLDHLKDHHERIITSSQVEMEFKKNRPKVIVSGFQSVGNPEWNRLKLPAYLARSKQSSGFASGKDRIKKQLKTLETRVQNVIENPTQYDPVYKAAQRLFRARSEFNLSRKKEVRFKIRELAEKRFMLGYPPRKSGDTSIGDALNWEWIIKCSQDTSSDVVIVSRDDDFGITFNKKRYINDWLAHEFKERCKKRKVTLTDRLAEGLKMAGIRVGKAERDSEEKFLEERTATPIRPIFIPLDGPPYPQGTQDLLTETDLRLIRNAITHGQSIPPSVIEQFPQLKRISSELDRFLHDESAGDDDLE